MSEQVTQPALESGPARRTERVPMADRRRTPDRRVVLVASGDTEPSLTEVVTNLATVCAETGQRVALVSTAGLGSPAEDSELSQSTTLWWKNWPIPGDAAGLSTEEEHERLLTGSLNPTDVEHLLGETGVPGVSRLDLRYFVGHPAQVVIRVPEVLAALLQIVDVVFLEVPSYLSVHHGEGLTPLADVVLVVAEREATTLDEVRRMSATLKRLDAPVVGMALTDGGVELYHWGRVEAELETSDGRSSRGLDPTEQIPIPESAGVAPVSAFDELSAFRPAPREA